MTILSVRLHLVELPLVRPFRTSFGTSTTRQLLVLRLETETGVGWAECAADPEPLYSAEFLTGASLVLRDHLLPRLLAWPDLDAAHVGTALAAVTGHPMAKHVLETAVLDAECRAQGQSFGERLGATRTHVPAGVSVGIADDLPALLTEVEGYLAAGYQRIKLKIEPGWDLAPVAAVCRAFGDVPLQVDANAAYTAGDLAHLARLDDFALLLVEQPFGEDDLVTHARAADLWSTPVCLDESIGSTHDLQTALALGACQVVNVKPSRVGGYLEAVRIHDLAVAHGVPVWCGGMLETGIGRSANLALAALPGFTLVGDVSASRRYYRQDLTEELVLRDGQIAVPTGAGTGLEVDETVLADLSTSVVELVGAPA
ncbi:o-succinylbenzoate synthase [Aeromicrobium sp. Sec7.5]|uniref:o-succinylbenzoate synthase n=1 Tax=Aeromicrobium sp. Sec7.5 TaxID=3121276 RepID=UPI002FE4F466